MVKKKTVLNYDLRKGRDRLTEKLQRNQRELFTFYRLSEIFLSSRPLEEAYNDIADEICAATGFPIASIGIYSEAERKIVIRGQRSRPGGASRPVFELPLKGTLSGEVIRSGKPLVATHLLEHKTYRIIGPRKAEIQTYVGYPMKTGDNVIGSLNLLHTKNVELDEDTTRWIESLANYVAVLTGRWRTEDELRQSREQLRELSRRTHSAVEDERKKIAREIHDELGQRLSLLQLDLGMIANRLPASEKKLRSTARSMTRLIDNTIRSIQKISTDLRPTLLDDLGLGAAVSWEVTEFQKRTKIRSIATIKPVNVTLDQDRSIALFRILQEALTNVLRHARATKVQVRMIQSEGAIVLSVRDDGRGITPKQIADPKSIGLIGMRERVQPWGGTVTFESQPDNYTEVVITIPGTR
jgi:signal transduction histidine kinase